MQDASLFKSRNLYFSAVSYPSSCVTVHVPLKGGTCPCTQKGFEYCTPKMKAKIKMGVTPMPYANDGMLSHRF